MRLRTLEASPAAQVLVRKLNIRELLHRYQIGDEEIATTSEDGSESRLCIESPGSRGLHFEVMLSSVCI